MMQFVLDNKDIVEAVGDYIQKKKLLPGGKVFILTMKFNFDVRKKEVQMVVSSQEKISQKSAPTP